MDEVIIVVNPGSTSTKLALFRREEKIAEGEVRHDAEELAAYDNVADQFEMRMHTIDRWLKDQDIEQKQVVAVVGRGAPLKPLEGGAYNISEEMLLDVKDMRYSNHASNLGAIIADYLGRRYKVPSMIVDPITIDNFTDLARVSGFPGIERKCRSHALNIKAVCRRVAVEAGHRLREVNFIAAHLGGGISIAAIERGRIIDVNDGLLGMGPFSPNRAGALPIGALVKLAYSGTYSEADLTRRLSAESGLQGYLGESDLRQVEKMIEAGDKKAVLYYRAMIYQVAKEICACAGVLKGDFYAVVITGGMAKSERLVTTLKEYISFLGRVVVIPGEFEMEALAAGAVRVIDGTEIPKDY